LKNFFGDLYRGKTDLSFHDVTKQMGLNLLDENASLSESKIPAIPQFLNRLLSLKTDMQNAVFGEFERRLVEAVEYAKQRGLYDVGLQTMTALSIQKTRDDVVYEDKNTGALTRYVELAVTNEIKYNSWKDAKNLSGFRRNADDLSGWFVSEFGKNKGEVFFLSDIGERINSEGISVRRGVLHTIRKHGHKYIDNADVIHRGYDYRTVVTNGAGSFQRVTLTRSIDEAEAEKLWKEQVENAPKTETKAERMIVGVILPIWDRVEGSETIKRLQTDDGEQLLGRMLGNKAAQQTLKNLGLNSGIANMSASELFEAVKKGSKAILSNGWEISTAKVNHEDRIEIKGRSHLTDAEKRVLKEQGAFSERINWADRVFIPTGVNGLSVFERITASKPVVDLIEKNANKEVNGNEEEQDYGIPQQVESDSVISSAVPEPANNDSVQSVSDGLQTNRNNHQEVIQMDQKKKPFHEIVAENLIRQLEAGTAPWQRPWDAGESGSFLPYNPTTGNRYKGINALHLMSQDRDDQRWMTYKQASEAGGQVRKGEKGTGIQYWKFTEEHTKKDDNGSPVLDSDGNPVKVIVRLERPRVFFATVFNGEQIDGLSPIEKKELTWAPVERAERILSASGANINHNGGGRAFYRPSTDGIHLPDKGQFPSADSYYATALHELGHWTGHQSRLDRDLAHPFGSEGYAKEELRAEIASMILGDELGIGHDPGQHAAYVGSWIKALKEDPLEIFRAAADAEKIHGYVLAFEQVQDQQHMTDLRLPHEMTLAEFSAQVTIERLENHGRKWNVILGDYSAFSDAGSSDSAIADVHRAAVNNALYLNSPGVTDLGDKPSLPSAAVLAEYPDLMAEYSIQPQAQKIKITAETETEDNSPTQEADMLVNNSEGDILAAKRNQIAQVTYINVPFREKNEVKQLGGRWDRQQKSWYIPPGVDSALFLKWTHPTGTAGEAESLVLDKGQRNNQDRIYLAVPYGERGAAKSAGALWDKAAKSWYAAPDADMSKLERWKPDNVPDQQSPAITPEEEFAEALKSLGCIVTGKQPIMDGKKHRIGVEGDKKGEEAGFYVGHLDGHPAGYIKNNRTGIELKWKSKGYALDPQEKAKLQAEAATKLAERAAEQDRLHDATSQRVSRQLENLVPITQPTPYLQDKGIQPHVGALTDMQGQKTYIPAFDVDGKQWTMQYIQEDGTKRFAKDSKKEGCFHPVGGMDSVAAAPVLIIAEGYATAASLSEALGQGTVAAFDSGNLPHVARALHEKFPDKPVIIAGDDDRHLEAIQGINPGRVKAEEAAKAVGGKAIFPIFAPGELGGNPKTFTDFNDLAGKSELGKAGVKRQVGTAVSKILLNEDGRQEQSQKPGQAHQAELRPQRAARLR
jgi:antirestriction protein ArdC/phage/plasmid primase-like uncharacterized protein